MYQSKNIPVLLAVLFAFALTSKSSQAQDQDLPPGLKNWYSGSFTVRTSKKASFKFSQLYALNTAPYKLHFVQSGFEYSRRLGDPWKGSLGYTHSIFRSDNGPKHFHRVYAQIRHRSRLGRVNMDNAIRAEFHTPQLLKYQYRFIYTNKLSLRTRNWPLKASPYIRNQVFYYYGGKPFNYYEEGELAASQAPNDFHRYRFSAGLRMKPAKNLSLTVYYMWQREFNTNFTEFRGINELNARETRVRRPFNNYQVIGVSIGYTLKTYNRHPKR